MSGLIHLYTGDGKGKTTAALGLLLRAYGQGMRVALVQFQKSRDTGELHALRDLPRVTVLRQTEGMGFYKFASDSDKAEMRRQNNANMAEAYRLIHSGGCDLLVLDEICAAYNAGALDKEFADKTISGKPPEVELILTGRDAPAHFAEAADYVTEFFKRKHPYDNGVTARKGIEF